MHTLVVFQQTNQLYHHIIRNSKSKLFSKIKKPAGGCFNSRSTTVVLTVVLKTRLLAARVFLFSFLTGKNVGLITSREKKKRERIERNEIIRRK
jgi:hypothetical protein